MYLQLAFCSYRLEYENESKVYSENESKSSLNYISW